MITVFSEHHRQHAARGEWHEGAFREPFEAPARADGVLEAVRQAGLGPLVAARRSGLGVVERVHSAAYLAFLEQIHADWAVVYPDEDAVPYAIRAGTQGPVPDGLFGRLGHYATDTVTPITAGTWSAACAAVDCALTAVAEVAEGASEAFALCRPPGHHASRERYGGYCYLNNAAIAAESWRQRGCERVAILDVDYHHGNGTQSIFYDRPDVLFVSLHADPRHAFPYFEGYAAEAGAGAGEGFTLNLPLPPGTTWEAYTPALERALDRIVAFGAEALVVSLGLDTYGGDPIADFRLTERDFGELGARLRRVAAPTVFVLEGGYAVEELGPNVVAVLRGG